MTWETKMQERYNNYTSMKRTEGTKARMMVIENIVGFPGDKTPFITFMLESHREEAQKGNTSEYEQAYLEELELIAKDLNL